MRRPATIFGLLLCVSLLGAGAFGVTTASALDEGQRAPEIGLRTPDGQTIRMSDLRGKVVVVDFWASWCAPCREELPVLQRLHEQYGERGVVVVGVGIDRNERDFRAFKERMGLTFPVVHDGAHAVAGRYEPPRMPSTFLIDRNGVIRHIHEGYRSSNARELESQIQAMLR
ncbi:MAG: TlpA family protein disulfide reductase [Sandaracinus sp.]|nr:TlpA family protein disulfide reductase [Sandaracinus sp.]MCB9624988.1 TlpA family protein disulfide reductase [Sandaracinus sp.]MCB9634728.1 TlpA family protein disulfide reductase [Sandaracinus sp.]